MSKSAKTIPLAKELQGKDAGSLLSAWSPLRESVFRALWIATVVSNVGTWMQDVGESWLMTSLTPSRVLVKIRERLSVNGLAAAGTVVFALATLSLAYIHSFGAPSTILETIVCCAIVVLGEMLSLIRGWFFRQTP